MLFILIFINKISYHEQTTQDALRLGIHNLFSLVIPEKTTVEVISSFFYF